MPILKIIPNNDADMKRLTTGLDSFKISYTKIDHYVTVNCSDEEASFLYTRFDEIRNLSY